MTIMMSSGPIERKLVVTDLARARTYAVTLITGAFGVGFLVSEFQRIQRLSLNSFTFSYLTLFVLVMSLVFLWIWATQKELDQLVEWMKPESYVAPSRLKETSMIVVEAVVLVVLLFSAKNPLVFAIVFTAYSLLVMVAVIHLNRELLVAFDDTEKSLAKEATEEDSSDVVLQSKGVAVLRKYFLARPHTPRHAIILLTSLVGIGIAWWWQITGAQSLGVISYLFFILIILVSEIVIGVWRNARDNDLRSVLGEIKTAQRAASPQ